MSVTAASFQIKTPEPIASSNRVAPTTATARAAAPKDPIVLRESSEHTHKFATGNFFSGMHVVSVKPTHGNFGYVQGMYPQGKKVVVYTEKGFNSGELAVLSLEDPLDHEVTCFNIHRAPTHLLMVGADQMLVDSLFVTCGPADPLQKVVRQAPSPPTRKPKSWAALAAHVSRPWHDTSARVSPKSSRAHAPYLFKDSGHIGFPRLSRYGDRICALVYDGIHESVFIGTTNGALVVKKADSDTFTVMKGSLGGYTAADDPHPVIFLGVLGKTLVLVDSSSVETWNTTTLCLESRYAPPLKEYDFWQDRGTTRVGIRDKRYLPCYQPQGVALDYTTGSLFASRYPQSQESGPQRSHLLDVFENVTTALEPRIVRWASSRYGVGTLAAANGVLFLQLKGTKGDFITAYHAENQPVKTTHGELTWPRVETAFLKHFSSLHAGKHALVLRQEDTIVLISLNRPEKPVEEDPLPDVILRHGKGYSDVDYQKEKKRKVVVTTMGTYSTKVNRQADKSTFVVHQGAVNGFLDTLVTLNLDQSDRDGSYVENTVYFRSKTWGNITLFKQGRFSISSGMDRETYVSGLFQFDAFTALGEIPQHIITGYLGDDSMSIAQLQNMVNHPQGIHSELYDPSSDTHVMLQSNQSILVVSNPGSPQPVSRVLARAPTKVVFMGLSQKKLVIVNEFSVEVWATNTFTRVGHFHSPWRNEEDKPLYAKASLDQTLGHLYVERNAPELQGHLFDVFENLDDLRPRRVFNEYPLPLISYDAENGRLYMNFGFPLFSLHNSMGESQDYGLERGMASMILTFVTSKGPQMNAEGQAVWPRLPILPLPQHTDHWPRYAPMLRDGKVVHGHNATLMAGKNAFLLAHDKVTVVAYKETGETVEVDNTSIIEGMLNDVFTDAERRGAGLPPVSSASSTTTLAKTATVTSLPLASVSSRPPSQTTTDSRFPTPIASSSGISVASSAKTAVAAKAARSLQPSQNSFDKALGYARPSSSKSANFVVEETAARETLSKLGKSLKEAVDNGDCLYHTFAILMNHQNKGPMTVETVRQKVASVAKLAENTVGQENWLLPYFGNDLDEFQRWAKNVAKTGAKPGTVVEWGNFERDAAILGRIYGLSFKLFMNGKFAETSFGMKSSKLVLEVAQFSQHFAPIFNDVSRGTPL